MAHCTAPAADFHHAERLERLHILLKELEGAIAAALPGLDASMTARLVDLSVISNEARIAVRQEAFVVADRARSAAADLAA